MADPGEGPGDPGARGPGGPGARGPGPPLCLDQTETRRTEKNFLRPTLPPTFLRVWMTAPHPYLRVWIRYTSHLRLLKQPLGLLSYIVLYGECLVWLNCRLLISLRLGRNERQLSRHECITSGRFLLMGHFFGCTHEG